jgi:hypothetical protein
MWSTYELNLAFEGGVIYCENCTFMSFVNSKFLNNKAYNGGIFSIIEQNMDEPIIFLRL